MDREGPPLYDWRGFLLRKANSLPTSLAKAWDSSPLLPILAVTVAYMVSGRLGLELAIPPGYATAVWPPSGIALAAVLLRGPTMWPGILLGSFCANVGNGFDGSSPMALAWSIGIPLAIATGASFQALFGAWLINRKRDASLRFADAGDVVRLFGLGGMVACLVNSSLSVTLLCLAGRIPPAAAAGSLATWWAGDAIGVFVFTPLVVCWTARPREAWIGRWRPMTLCLTSSFCLTVMMVGAITTLERDKLGDDFSEFSNQLVARLQRELPPSGRALDEVAANAFAGYNLAGIHYWVLDERLAVGADVVTANTVEPPGPFRVAERGLFGGKIEIGDRLPLSAGGDGWILQTAPTQEYFARHRLTNSWTVMIGGLLFTGLLGAFVMVVTGREPALRRLVERRTAMLAASEARLREYSEAVADWFWETDKDHRFTFFSESFETTLGRNPDNMIGKRRWDVANETMEVDPEQWEAHIADLTAHRPFRDFKYWISDDSGRPKWIKVSGIPRYDANGIFLGYRGTGTDVTSAVANAHRMHMLNRAVEQSPVSVVITDLEPRIEYVNAKFLGTSGYERDEVIGQNPSILKSGLTPPETFDEMWRTLTEDREWHGEFVNLRKNGEAYWELATVQPIHDLEGKVTNYLAIKTDITERKRTEARMAELMDELRRSNAELEQFAYIASHDLRQPLRMVTSYVELLERRLGDRLDQEEREFIDFARDGARRMDRLIVDLLDYSRIGRSTDLPEMVDLGEVLAETRQNLEVAIEEAAAVLRLPPSLPTIPGNYTELMRLFQNLIGNAIKYRAPGTAPAIEVSCHAEEGFWVLSVKDNGIGIPADQLDRIFGVFQRLHTRETYDGTGIGLAVCRKVAESHGGRISARSEVGVGSEFLVTLPRSTAMEAAP